MAKRVERPDKVQQGVARSFEHAYRGMIAGSAPSATWLPSTSSSPSWSGDEPVRRGQQDRLAFLILTILLVFVTELFNTAMEFVVDLATKDYHPLAKLAKDVSAGAVTRLQRRGRSRRLSLLADDSGALSGDPGEHKAVAGPPHARLARRGRAHRPFGKAITHSPNTFAGRDAFRPRGGRFAGWVAASFHRRRGRRRVVRRAGVRITLLMALLVAEPRRKRPAQRLTR